MRRRGGESDAALVLARRFGFFRLKKEINSSNWFCSIWPAAAAP